MNLVALQYFREVVEAKSISKVAQSSHISQSALSQMIQKLEDEVGYKLLERSNKGVKPTEMGRIVFKYSGTITRVCEKMDEELTAHAHSVENIRINGYNSFVNHSLPCVLYKVKKKFPNLKFELHSKSSEESIKDLVNELTDVCFVSEEPSDKRLDYQTIGKEKVVLVANADRKIDDVIDIQELFEHEMVLLDNESIISDFLKRKLNDVDLDVTNMNIMFEVDSIAAAKSTISNNLGICFMPYMSIKKELYEKQFKIVEVRDFDLDYNIYIASRERASVSESVQQIFDYFVKNGSKEFC